MVETYIRNPLECIHAPKGVNTSKGGHDYDQISKDSQTQWSGSQLADLWLMQSLIVLHMTAIRSISQALMLSMTRPCVRFMA